jgi:hypothetical protein
MGATPRVTVANVSRICRVTARTRRVAVRTRRAGGARLPRWCRAPVASVSRHWRVSGASQAQIRRVAGASAGKPRFRVNFVNRSAALAPHESARLDSPLPRSTLRPRPQAAPDTEPGGGWDSQGKDTR